MRTRSSYRSAAERVSRLGKARHCGLLLVHAKRGSEPERLLHRGRCRRADGEAVLEQVVAILGREPARGADHDAAAPGSGGCFREEPGAITMDPWVSVASQLPAHHSDGAR